MENVIHEVFYKIIAKQSTRQSFSGGNLAAWLSTVAKNQAIDYAKKNRLERPTDPDKMGNLIKRESSDPELEAEYRQLADLFCREHLPKKWVPVFQARWIRRISQRQAAAELGMLRTTLAYQELRIRRLLDRFLQEVGAE
jgi:RNA polymerase sigma-70 factor (ECF subfamily)